MGLDPGIELIKAQRGLASKIARELKLSSGTVPQWRKVPTHHLAAVERITGIPRDQLRPDIFAPPVPSQAAPPRHARRSGAAAHGSA